MLRKNLVVRKNFVPLHPQLSNKVVADTGCSAVGSVPGLGPGCRRFESCHPDEERIIQVILSFLFTAILSGSRQCMMPHVQKSPQKRQKDIIKGDFLEEREKCSILALPKPPPGC